MEDEVAERRQTRCSARHTVIGDYVHVVGGGAQIHSRAQSTIHEAFRLSARLTRYWGSAFAVCCRICQARLNGRLTLIGLN